MSEDNTHVREYILDADSELRFEIEQKDAKVFVTLISGFAELFGTELVKKKKYEFGIGAKVAIFTYQGCVLQVTGKMDVCYISKETPMVQYINCHAALEQFRIEAEEQDKRGPVILIVGPMDVDLDVGQGAISISGNIATILIERPASVEEGFAKTAPLVYHFGHKSPSGNSVLYNAVVSKMAEVTLQSLDANKRTKSSGIIVNTCGWVKGYGYKHLLHAARAYRARAIFVLDQERLYNDLLRDVPTNVHVVLLPKSGGVVERTKELRHESREQRIKEYFYGNMRTPFYPFSFEVKFQDLRLYKIGAPPLPDSCMPIGMKAEDNKKKVVAVTPTPSLLHHILTLSFAESTDENVIGTNIAGFCCVTEVDMERQSVMLLSPQPRPLPANALLLWSELQFMDNHA
ncbi:protein CLP1 homolog isoform X2 [Drosophila hydei]|uniref:Protein CLP1 homolog isoform X2 n=1 Tax=Drosophila hydei TaxID=7224 RepID=A0A6J1LTE0_DROHY|nr:protein CLP1 homolog isoform X2 [Drosophila hydei]